MNLDKIFICGLKTNAIIGVYEEEKTIKQPIELDITFFTDISKAAHSDDVNDTLDYADVTQKVITWIDETKFELIEKLAEHIATRLIDAFPIQAVRLRLKKFPRGLQAAYTAVEIKRGKGGSLPKCD
ncbi:MAG: folB [Gammaproteobacteria bacterium]|jgi:dihydroneopterin aldolase|nr:folB [Gammaproteobacteria bacterium]